MLLRVARQRSSVVAVVGRGHLQGIKKNWNQPIKVSHILEFVICSSRDIINHYCANGILQMKDLLEIPTNESVFTVKNCLISLAIVVAGTAIVSRIYLASTS